MKLVKAFLVLIMAGIMSVTMITVAGAEEVTTESETTMITVVTDNDGSRAYELVWKYKRENGHVYKRRWNATLNCWYDPAWILVV